MYNLTMSNVYIIIGWNLYNASYYTVRYDLLTKEILSAKLICNRPIWNLYSVSLFYTAINTQWSFETASLMLLPLSYEWLRFTQRNWNKLYNLFFLQFIAICPFHNSISTFISTILFISYFVRGGNDSERLLERWVFCEQFFTSLILIFMCIYMYI